MTIIEAAKGAVRAFPFFPSLALWRSRLYNLAAYGRPDVFGNVNVETVSACNRRCRHCPVTQHPRAERTMEEGLFRRLIDQLAARGYRGEISFHWYGEPLLDPFLPERVLYARRRCPDAFLFIASNGDLLTASTIRGLLAAGLDRIVVQNEAGEESPHLAGVLAELTDRERAATTVGTKPRGFWRNRAGAVPSAPLPAPLAQRCANPDFMIVVDVEGRVLLCCNDYFGEEVVGDVATEDIFDLWRKPRFREARRALRRGDRGTIGICRRCDWWETNLRLPKGATRSPVRFIDYT